MVVREHVHTRMHEYTHAQQQQQQQIVFIDIKYSGHDLQSSTKAYFFNGVNITEPGVFKARN